MSPSKYSQKNRFYANNWCDHFFLNCFELSNNEIIFAELKLYSTLKGSLNEYSCLLFFYQINEHQLPNMAKISKMLFCISLPCYQNLCLANLEN
jgi:hypothetical protein